MPTTINGVGTHYYGKWDASSRVGQCEHCKADGKLETYTTRLWFVVVFIPVIPLKRVRILDCCPRCQKHWVLNPDEYEKSKKVAVSGALEKYRDHPSVETALEAHANLLMFHLHKEADTFRALPLEQYPDSVELRIGFASHLDEMGRWNDSTPLYEQAFALKADDPVVRHALAWRKTNGNQFDEAYELLDFMRRPGASQSFNLQPLELLAQGYQKAKNHERVLELCEHLLREVPSAADHYAFRNLVAQSEKALDRSPSILPPIPFSIRSLFSSTNSSYSPRFRRMLIGSIIAIVLAVILAVSNEHFRRNRTLYIVNGFAQPAMISLDGAPPIQITRPFSFSVSEGHHRILVKSPVVNEQDIVLQSGYWSRWTYRPIWIFNVEQAAQIEVTKIHYSVNPQPSETNWLDGEELNYVPHVDYAFVEPPKSMKLDRSTSVTKMHVACSELPPSSVFVRLQRGDTSDVALTYAEGHLTQNPNDPMLLQAYSRDTSDERVRSRITEFLKGGLWRKPVSIPWHRCYRSVITNIKQEDELRDEVDAHIQLAPDDATLLYLRGYVSLIRAERLKYLQMANEKAPLMGWPSYSLAAEAMNRGDWIEARQWCDKAESALRSDLSFRGLRHLVKIANQETGPLEAEYRQLIQSQKFLEMMQSAYYLSDVLAAQQKYDQARQLIHQWWAQLLGPNAPASSLSSFDPMLDYVCGDLDGFRKRIEKDKSVALGHFDFHHFLAIGEPDAAIKMENTDKILDEWPAMLAVSISYSLMDKSEEAALWRSKACEKMRGSDSSSKRAADLLQQNKSPTREELDEISLRHSETLGVLAALAQRFSAQNNEIKERARRINVSRLPPYLLVKKAVE